MNSFICRLVKDCATNDGVREYIFPAQLGEDFSGALSHFGSIKRISNNGKTFLRLHKKGYFKINYLESTTRVLVIYENDLHPEARQELEEAFKQSLAGGDG